MQELDGCAPWLEVSRTRDTGDILRRLTMEAEMREYYELGSPFRIQLRKEQSMNIRFYSSDGVRTGLPEPCCNSYAESRCLNLVRTEVPEGWTGPWPGIGPASVRNDH